MTILCGSCLIQLEVVKSSNDIFSPQNASLDLINQYQTEWMDVFELLADVYAWL